LTGRVDLRPAADLDITATSAQRPSAKAPFVLGVSPTAWLPGRAVAIFGGITSWILNIVIALFGLYYLLPGAGPLWIRTKRLLPVADRVAEQLAARFVEVTEALRRNRVTAAVTHGKPGDATIQLAKRRRARSRILLTPNLRRVRISPRLGALRRGQVNRQRGVIQSP